MIPLGYSVRISFGSSVWTVFRDGKKIGVAMTRADGEDLAHEDWMMLSRGGEL